MEEKNVILEITNDGSCLAIYTDNSGLDVLGDLRVTRLSDIEYDNEQKGWVVRFRNGVVLANLYQDRIKALSAEMSYVEENLSELGDWVKKNHPEAVHVGTSYPDASMS